MCICQKISFLYLLKFRLHISNFLYILKSLFWFYNLKFRIKFCFLHRIDQNRPLFNFFLFQHYVETVISNFKQISVLN